MANNRINKYVGTIAFGTLLTMMPGCTDTWDDHYNIDGSASTETATLWEVIKSNPNYSRFADIVQHAKYYKDDTHPVSTYSYADILNGGQINTIWVPDNSALTEEEYQKWMGMLANVAEGNTKDGYNVQQQFIGNHIALWRHNISEPGLDTVKMINGKNLEFDKTKRTLGGIVLGECNIPTANGVMHVLTGVAPFHHNFYESLKFRDVQTKLGKYVVSKDTTYFSAASSIEGLPDENGNPTYVDSVYRTSNRLFETSSYLPEEGREKWQTAEKCFNANINNEDSVFVMLMPTDAAWDAAYESLKEGYNYAEKYADNTKVDLGSTSSTIDIPNVDSLQKMNIEMDMVAPLVFNIHKQPKINGEKMWTVDEFMQDRGERAEYLLNTYGDTLRNLNDWEKSSLFEGVEPIKMSNGIAYEVSSWNFPREYYMPDVEVEIENTGQFYKMTNASSHKLGSKSRKYSFSNEVFKEVTDVFGKVSNGNFYHLEYGDAKPKVGIKLFGNNPNAYVPNAQVMSGKYDIQVVLVPYWYINIANSAKIDEDFYIVDTLINENKDTTIVREIDMNYVKNIASRKYKFKASITRNNGKKDDPVSLGTNFTYEAVGVDTITLKKDFEFPYTYKNMRFTYPILLLEGAASSTDKNKGFIFDIVIDKVILKRKTGR